MAAPNIVNISNISLKSSLTLAPAVVTPVISNTSGSGTILKVNTITVTNTTTTPVDFTMDILRGGVSYPIAYTLTVPDKSTMVVSGKDTAFYLEEVDQLRCFAATASVLSVLVSYEILS